MTDKASVPFIVYNLTHLVILQALKLTIYYTIDKSQTIIVKNIVKFILNYICQLLSVSNVVKVPWQEMLEYSL